LQDSSNKPLTTGTSSRKRLSDAVFKDFSMEHCGEHDSIRYRYDTMVGKVAARGE